ncbi:hepatic sodium/bile acid cotransporter-like isoform X2 [Condylostylus longicornis]|uniref:hepatic sodium/bile acid cotransporter-like isoform X2 n=1 Tax=Condylostylus longicornis TaxID=2530218 RepID=UPI00244E3AD7|nr:hepatic sodium/bile acid cotransporter-like isoform X2 [Condylostylus longicornis]
MKQALYLLLYFVLGSHINCVRSSDSTRNSKSKLCAKSIFENEVKWMSDGCQNIIVLKEFGIADQIFTISIAIVVTIIFISFGACLDIDSLKEILIKPVGPIIGFCCQFILMPTISYLIGYVLFWDDVNMWLGLFFSGVSPGGGASNMWTLILKGNVNLSIVMTTISNLAAFAMMPLWIFTLGATIFNRGNLGVPYERVAVFSVSLIIPLVIGILVKKFQPKLANILIRLLKPITIIILVYIMTFAIILNFYVFKLFTWKIILAGMGLPWFGYILSYLIALMLKQNKEDCLTISIETGLQNTGIAMFLLRFSLEQPEADLTSVIPVAVSFMTLLPLLILYSIQRFLCTSAMKEEDISTNPNEEERIMSPPSIRNQSNL